MPELPEVQTVVNDLQVLTSDTITGFWSSWEKNLKANGEEVSAVELQKLLTGKKINKISRLGKFLLFELSSNSALLMHLRMTGQLLINFQFPTRLPDGQVSNFQKNAAEIINKAHIHARHVFKLKSGKFLVFTDIRKFGTIEYFENKSISQLEILKKLGIDPLGKNFNQKKLLLICAKRPKTPIKDLLMKQDWISGIGNIYASEILHAAKVSPQKSAGHLSQNELKEVVSQTKKILRLAIKLRGTSVSDYRDASGSKGGFQKVLRVYKRQNHNCKSCGTIIRRSIIGQRSTFFCPKCQK